MKPILVLAMRWYAAQAGVELVIQKTGSGFYAAFRSPGADELTPELGWGEGPTLSQALNSAFDSFVANGH